VLLLHVGRVPALRPAAGTRAKEESVTRDGSDLVLSTGTRIYAYAGILGLCVSSSDPYTAKTLHYGYDGVVESDEPLTAPERAEIAEHMTRLWREWAERA
jgi:hypothetical protein